MLKHRASFLARGVVAVTGGLLTLLIALLEAAQSMDTLNHPVSSVNTPVDIEYATPEQKTAYFNALKEWADLNTYTPANCPPLLPPIDDSLLQASEAARSKFTSSHYYCFPQNKKKHDIQIDAEVARMRKRAELSGNRSCRDRIDAPAVCEMGIDIFPELPYKVDFAIPYEEDIDVFSPMLRIKEDCPSQSRMIIQRQGAVLRVKKRRTGEDTGKVFENGWNARPDTENDLLSEYPSDFVNSHSETPKKRGNKNAISDFSAASRRNLVDKFLSLKPSMWVNAKFLTLTYHENYGSPAEAKNHKRAFLKRIQRYCGSRRGMAYKPSFFWRLEPKKRLSGENKGKVAPHFHLFLFGCPYIPQGMLLRWWQEITGDDSITQVRVERLDNYRKAMNYVAKYTAKLNDKDAFLDISLYLAAIGRYWGFEGGENIEFDDCKEVNLPVLTPALLQFIQICEGFFPHVKNRQCGSSSGFRVFEFEETGLAWLDAVLDECLFSDDLAGGDIEF